MAQPEDLKTKSPLIEEAATIITREVETARLRVRAVAKQSAKALDQQADAAAANKMLPQITEKAMQDPTSNDRSFSESHQSSASNSTPAAGSGTLSSDGSVADQAKQVAGQAANDASSIVDQVKDKAIGAVEEQKAGVADQIENLASSVRKSGEQFSGQQDWIASAIERAAAELSTLATSLRENDVNALFGQARTFARQQPAVFIGASFAAGFALARFGKIVAADVSRDDLPTLPEVGHGQG